MIWSFIIHRDRFAFEFFSSKRQILRKICVTNIAGLKRAKGFLFMKAVHCSVRDLSHFSLQRFSAMNLHMRTASSVGTSKARLWEPPIRRHILIVWGIRAPHNTRMPRMPMKRVTVVCIRETLPQENYCIANTYLPMYMPRSKLYRSPVINELVCIPVKVGVLFVQWSYFLPVNF
jgi:hypothetical protein